MSCLIELKRRHNKHRGAVEMAVEMPVGWALIKPHEEGREKLANVNKLKKLAEEAHEPWAGEVEFVVRTPLPVKFTSTGEERKWEAMVEIRGVSPGELKPIFRFIEGKCSHVDGIG